MKINKRLVFWLVIGVIVVALLAGGIAITGSLAGWWPSASETTTHGSEGNVGHGGGNQGKK